jgi:Icc-related predicted phosphoesterase
VPGMIFNRIRYGRYLDVFVTHAPPEGVHDRPDLPHQGIRAFRWLIQVFQPEYCIHGHVHVYRPDEPTETRIGPTHVVNAFGYREIDFNRPPTPHR